MASAVVTGAGRGIGREIARRLAQRGFDVLATDIDAAAAERTAAELGGRSGSMAHDVRVADEHAAVAAAAQEIGPLRVWVNNAGILRTRRAWEHDADEERLLVEVNLLGLIAGSRTAVEAMRHSGGDVINVASLSSLTAAPGLAVYAATKHGVLGYTTSLHYDLALEKLPVRVHAVLPDSVGTDMVAERAGESASSIIFTAPRMLTPEEVAEAAVGTLDTGRVVTVIPRSRGVTARLFASFPGASTGPLGLMGRYAERRRRRFLSRS